MRLLRTPDERFAGLPDYPFAPHYLTLRQGIRVHYLDEGSGPVVLLLHGEPTWSYLYRHVVPGLVGAGLRVVAPDLVGFGRSDKPADVADHSYAAHVGWMREVLEGLELTDVTLVGQDWGGLIGLRVLAELPQRFARVVASNTGLPTGEQPMPAEWLAFRDFSARVEDFPVGFLISRGCATEMAAEVVAAYEAPFPDATYKAACKAMPTLVPTSVDDPAHPAQLAAWAALERFDRPFLCAFSDADPITRGADRPFRERVPGAQGQSHTTVVGGGHFLQEDRGPQLAAVVADFVRST